jgi:GDP-D-mannose dehydratase
MLGVQSHVAESFEPAGKTADVDAVGALEIFLGALLVLTVSKKNAFFQGFNVSALWFS